MSESELRQRVTELERAVVDIRRKLVDLERTGEATRRRTIDEVQAQFTAAMGGVERHITQTLRTEVQHAVKHELGPYAEKLAHFDAALAVVVQLPDLLGTINKAKDTMIRFEERERVLAESKTDGQMKAEQRLKRWQVYAAVLVPIGAIIVALIGAAIGSHR